MKVTIVLELAIDTGSLFHWSTTLTLKEDLWISVLYSYAFNFVPLVLVTVAIFIPISFFWIGFIELLSSFKDFDQVFPDSSFVERELVKSL